MPLCCISNISFMKGEKNSYFYTGIHPLHVVNECVYTLPDIPNKLWKIYLYLNCIACCEKNLQLVPIVSQSDESYKLIWHKYHWLQLAHSSKTSFRQSLVKLISSCGFFDFLVKLILSGGYLLLNASNLFQISKNESASRFHLFLSDEILCHPADFIMAVGVLDDISIVPW